MEGVCLGRKCNYVFVGINVLVMVIFNAGCGGKGGWTKWKKEGVGVDDDDDDDGYEGGDNDDDNGGGDG